MTGGSGGASCCIGLVVGSGVASLGDGVGSGLRVVLVSCAIWSSSNCCREMDGRERRLVDEDELVERRLEVTKEVCSVETRTGMLNLREGEAAVSGGVGEGVEPVLFDEDHE